MNLTRRSFLRSLGAALLTPLLPKGKAVPEEDQSALDVLRACDCFDRSTFRLGSSCDGDDEFAVADDYFLPNAWMRYPRAEWDWTVDPTDAYVEEVEWAARLEEIMADFHERMRNADWEAPAYTVVMHPDTLDWWYANVPWFRRAVDGFDV